MQIQYPFSTEKAILLMVSFLGRIGSMDKLKLVKLLYLADRDCFLKFGHPITGDELWALPHGPAPSNCVNLINGDQQSDIYRFIRTENNKVSAVCDAVDCGAAFSGDERAIIENVVAEHGRKTTSEIYHFVHELPEYRRHQVPQSSAPIPFTTLLEFYGGERKFRNGRAVITREMRQHMVCPLPPVK